jgi:gliding motility-associated-like protein
MGLDNNLWTSMQGEKVIQKFENAGIYPVALVVSNEFGCYDTLVKAIKVLPDLNVFVPNAFTPNGDNKNDLFRPVLRSAQSLHFVVYDRWGEKLFETGDLNAGWDGTFKGEECKADVYVWKLSVKGLAGQANGVTAEKNYRGEVLLIR